MTAPSSSLIYRNAAFGWAVAATGVLLLIPLIAMRFTGEVNWTGREFSIMGALLFGISSLFIMLARKVPANYRLLTALVCLGVFLLVWAELAVGVFTNWGS